MSLKTFFGIEYAEASRDELAMELAELLSRSAVCRVLLGGSAEPPEPDVSGSLRERSRGVGGR